MDDASFVFRAVAALALQYLLCYERESAGQIIVEFISRGEPSLGVSISRDRELMDVVLSLDADWFVLPFHPVEAGAERRES